MKPITIKAGGLECFLEVVKLSSSEKRDNVSHKIKTIHG